MANLVVIGGVALDLLFRVKDIKADTTQVLEYTESIGGMGYNTAVAAAQLGVRTRLVSAIGKDFPEKPLRNIRDLTLEFYVVGDTSTRSFMFYDENGEKTYFYKGAYHEIPIDKAKNAISKADWVHFAGIAPCFIELVKFADEEHKVICFNPGYDIFHYDPQDKVLKELVAKSDYMVLSSAEARHLNKPLDNIANIAVIVTMGKNGSMLVNGGKRTQINAYPVKLESPFGAGDTYTGAFIAGMIHEHEITKAAKLASAAASFAVEEKSTIPRLSWDEIEKRAKKL